MNVQVNHNGAQRFLILGNILQRKV